MHQTEQKYLQCALQLFNVSDHYHYCNNNDNKSTGRTWRLGFHWQSWYRSGTTELFVNCSSQLHFHFWSPLNKTWSQCEFQNGSINKLTGMSMSQSFFMKIDFIVNIACSLKLSINYWTSFDLPSHLMLSSQKQVPVCTAQISIFILIWSLPLDFAALQAETS